MTPEEIREALKRVAQLGSDRFETKCRRKDGEIVDVEVYATVMSTRPTHVVAVFLRDVTERQRAEQALRESEARYRELLDHSRDAIYVTTMDGEFIDANPAMLKLFGYRREEIDALNARALYQDPEDRSEFQQHVALLGSVKDFSVKLRKKNGAILECLLTATARRDQSGSIVEYEGVIRDVTEQRQTERALKKNEHRLAEAERLARLGSWEWDMRDGTVDWSDELYRVLGEESGDSRPSYDSFRQRIHADDSESVDRLVQRAIESGEPFESFHRIVRPDGAERILHSRGEVIHDENGQPVQMLGSAQDVTDLKRAEQALRESEERYRVLFENAPIGIGLADREGKLLTFNRAMLEPGGYDSKDELANVADLYVDPSERTRMLESFQEHGTVRQAETRFKRKGDGWYDAALSLNPVTIDGRDAVLAIVQDITERKRTERSLKQSEARYRAIVEDQTELVVRWLPDGTRTFVNQACCNFLGETVDDVVGTSFFPLLPREDLEKTKQRIAGLTPEQPTVTGENRTASLDDEMRWVQWTDRGIFDDNGRLVELQSAGRDITARKQVEDELRESEERFRAIFEQAAVGIVLAAPDGTFFSVNQRFCDIVGYELRELIGTSFRDITHPDDRAEDERHVQQLLRGEASTFTMEKRYLHRSGHTVWASLTVSLVRKASGEAAYWIGVIRDISERKAVERKLRLTQFAVDNAADAVFWVEAGSHLTYVNHAACESLGYSRDELLSLSIADFDETVEVAMWPDLWAHLKQAGYLKRPFIHKRKDGTRFPVEIVASFMDFEGEESAVAFVRDLTERHRAEEALRSSEERLSKAFGMSPDAIMISSLADGRIIQVNESFTRLSGFDADEANGRTATELGLWGADSTRREQWTQKLRSEGRIRDEEISFFDRSGKTLVCLVAAEVIDLDGEPHLLTYATDITERKRAEEQIRESREQLRQLAARVQSVREEERTAIAREIHDELGQALTGMKMDLSWLIGRFPTSSEPLLERGQALTTLLDSTINTVRDLSTRLRPSVLDDLGLAAAVDWQTQDLERRTGIEVHLEIEGTTEDLDRDRATAVFRILQEALTNVVRHAKAGQVTVTLRREDQEAVLEVNDDGKGIGEDQLRSPQSLGILGMRERAFAFGGSVDVERSQDGGTMVTARVPLGERVSNG
jgi:PAS domain S-box-containing protein